jgi:uncharacterized protein
VVGRAAAADVPTKTQGKEAGFAVVQRVFGNSGSALDREPVQSQADADRIARQRFAGIALGYVCGDGVCIGDPNLRAGTVVKIEGLGTRFSGLYYVTQTQHCFTPRKGYRTHFSARRNAT